MSQKLNVIVYGIKVKLKRGENIDDILESYTKLTDDEKQQIMELINDN